MIKSNATSSPSRTIGMLSLSSFLLASLYVLQQAFEDFQIGGHLWKHGDWLINSELTPTRRAFIGNLILKFSDILGITPVTAIWIIQSCLFIFSIGLLLLLIKPFKGTPVIWLVILSPAFFIFFWAASPQAGMRKELIIYISFLCLLMSYIHLNMAIILIIISVFIFSIGVLSHEAMALFLPAYVFCLLLSGKKNKLPSFLIYMLVVVTLSTALGAIIYAATYPSVDNFQQVCQPLLDRGLDASICDGAIRWLQYDAQRSSEIVQSEATLSKWLKLAAAYLLSTAGFCFFASHTNAPYRVTLLYVVAAIPFFPLFFLGLDWGRWINFHFSSAVFSVIALLLAGKITIERSPNYRYFVPFLLSNFFWSIGHIAPLVPFGIVGQAYRTLS